MLAIVSLADAIAADSIFPAHPITRIGQLV
jgi:hypothetical protein